MLPFLEVRYALAPRVLPDWHIRILSEVGGLRLIARGQPGTGSCPGPGPTAGRRPPGSPDASPRFARAWRSCPSRSRTRPPLPAGQRNGPAGPHLPDTTKTPGSTRPRGDSGNPALGTAPCQPQRFRSVSGSTFAPPRHPHRSHTRSAQRKTHCCDSSVRPAQDPLAVLLPST